MWLHQLSNEAFDVAWGFLVDQSQFPPSPKAFRFLWPGRLGRLWVSAVNYESCDECFKCVFENGFESAPTMIVDMSE